MSLPRRVVPGTTYLVTRRCYQRTFRLRPSPLTNQVFLYSLALAAAKTGVVIHAVCVMSNHHHLVLTDVQGLLPEFLRELHRSTAKAINASQGQWENLWSAEPTNVVALGDGEDVARKMAYVVTNPVDAGLVADPSEWPGVILWGDKEVPIARPDEYFAPNGKAPTRLSLRVQFPAAPKGRRAFDRARLAKAISDRLAEAHRAVRAVGLSFLGRAGVLATSFVARARSYEQKRGMVPTVAAADPEVRKALLRTRRSFLGAYFDALRRWCDGVREARFPFGTWWMRVHHGASVRAAALSEELTARG
jgi:REP element-mobilizing transposase RayT